MVGPGRLSQLEDRPTVFAHYRLLRGSGCRVRFLGPRLDCFRLARDTGV